MTVSSYKFSNDDFRGGTLEKIFDLTLRQCDIMLSIIYPMEDGWGTIDLLDRNPNTDFCSLIQTSEEGAKHCRMCHVLMTVAACSRDVTEQKCHAGTTVIINPIEKDGEGRMALLSSCMFRSEEKSKSWRFLEKRAEKLGVDAVKLKKHFNNLPELNRERRHCLERLMPLAVAAVKDVVQSIEMREEIKNLRRIKGKSSPGELLQREFLNVAKAPTGLSGNEEKIPGLEQEGAPTLIKVVCSLISRRPQMPYTVEEIATAARLTSNYFSSIFHKYTGQRFVDYITDRRIDMAKKLLLDPAINISEVASMCGYDDPGYFTRRFRQKTGVTPSVWREKGDQT